MQTIFEPKAARHFASLLRQESRDMRGRTATMRTALSELRSTWKDAKYDAFCKLFEDTTVDLTRFTAHVDEYAQYLSRKADIIDRYLRHRY